MSTTIIAGAGHAGGQTAISLRQAGYEGRIIVCGAEPVPPYQRPPLSKKYLSGELALARVFLRPESFYSKHDIELRLGDAIREIDPQRRTAVFENGEPLAFTDLVIATGSRPRRLDAPGVNLGNIFYLRSLEDTDAIRNALVAGGDWSSWVEGTSVWKSPRPRKVSGWRYASSKPRTGFSGG